MLLWERKESSDPIEILGFQYTMYDLVIKKWELLKGK